MNDVGTMLPFEIFNEVRKEQERLDWPHCVPKYLEFRDGSGKVLFCLYKDLTVAMCEQATEFHSRRALVHLKRFLADGHIRHAKRAARDIVKARVLRCRYIQLVGKADSTEDDMPFANGRYYE